MPNVAKVATVYIGDQVPSGERTSRPTSVSVAAVRLVFITTHSRPSAASFMLKWSSAALLPDTATSVVQPDCGAASSGCTAK